MCVLLVIASKLNALAIRWRLDERIGFPEKKWLLIYYFSFKGV